MFSQNLRSNTTILLLLCFLVGSVFAQKIKTKVILSFPTPGPSPQGLAWDGKSIWIADDETGTIYNIDPESGQTITSLVISEGYINGLAWDGENLLAMEVQNNKINKFVLLNDKGNYNLFSSNAPIIPYIPLNKMKYWGLVWIENKLYINIKAGWSSQIVKIHDNEITYLTFTRGNSKGLTYDGKYIWNCIDSRP
jgi:hypothetical protein